MNPIRNAGMTLNRIIAFPFIVIIALYQKTLSPDHGLLRYFFRYGICKHSPTCSEYAMNELHESFLPIALVRMIRRILSCNPWTTSNDERLRKAIQNQYTASAD